MILVPGDQYYKYPPPDYLHDHGYSCDQWMKLSIVVLVLPPKRYAEPSSFLVLPQTNLNHSMSHSTYAVCCCHNCIQPPCHLNQNNIQLELHFPTCPWVLMMHCYCVMLQLDDPLVIEIVSLYLPMSFNHGSWFLMYKVPFDPHTPTGLW